MISGRITFSSKVPAAAAAAMAESCPSTCTQTISIAVTNLTEPGQTVVRHDVTIASPLNLPATMPEHASELYSKNITALLDLLITDGKLAPDFDDEVIAASCVTRAATGAER